MSEKAVSTDLLQRFTDSVLQTVWIQWKSLGTYVDAKKSSSSIVDPDSLLLISLSLRHRERRLWDVLDSWAKNGSSLFSIQRIKNLIEEFPLDTRTRLAEFAYRAVNQGKDHRWKTLMGSEAGPDTRSHILWEAYPSDWHPTALMLRVRLGFGIGIVSDLLSYLISMHGDWSSAATISRAIDFSPYSLRRTADDMASAGILETTGEKPIRYRINYSWWGQILNIQVDEIAGWRYWNELFAFSADFLARSSSVEWGEASPYLLSSQQRDLVELHEDAFKLNKISYPDPGRYPGEEYTSAFNSFITDLSEWLVEAV
ncbi:MAG: hypothetical protein P1P76_09925 [Anaerolineales bacterium]|nr:hypothetical protein [Anaerolineales bacterium]